MFKTILTLFIFFQLTLSAKNFELHFESMGTITYKKIYDTMLPFLLRMSITDSNQSIETQSSIISDFLHNWKITDITTPDHRGLGSDGTFFFENISSMITSGNLQCSEIGYLGAEPFRVEYKTARVDVDNHTLFEILVNNKWIIMDPAFNMQLKNRNGEFANFKELSLDSKEKLTSSKTNSNNEIIKYRKLFTKSLYTPQTKKDFENDKTLRVATFGSRKIVNAYFHEEMKILTFEEFLETAKKLNLSKIREGSVNMYVLYYLPYLYFYYTNDTKTNILKLVYNIQDILLKKIEEETKLLWSKEYFQIWMARQLQFLGRIDEGNKILKNLKKKKIWNNNLLEKYIQTVNKLKLFFK